VIVLRVALTLPLLLLAPGYVFVRARSDSATAGVVLRVIVSMCTVMALALFLSATHLGITPLNVVVGVAATLLAAAVVRRVSKQPGPARGLSFPRRPSILVAALAATAAIALAGVAALSPGTANEHATSLSLTGASAREPIVVGDDVQYAFVASDGSRTTGSVRATACDRPLVIREGGRLLEVAVQCRS
jgi:hypothetical protein